jgi:hypothetical protein
MSAVANAPGSVIGAGFVELHLPLLHFDLESASLCAFLLVSEIVDEIKHHHRN